MVFSLVPELVHCFHWYLRRCGMVEMVIIIVGVDVDRILTGYRSCQNIVILFCNLYIGSPWQDIGPVK